MARGGLSEGGGFLAGRVWLLSKVGDFGAADDVVSISIGSIIALVCRPADQFRFLINDQVEEKV